MTTVPREDNLVLIRDFNAKVSQNPILWTDTMGRKEVGKTNSNCVLLLTKYSEHNLVITTTLLRQKNNFETSWMHLHSKMLHFINCVIVCIKDCNEESRVCINEHLTKQNANVAQEVRFLKKQKQIWAAWTRYVWIKVQERSQAKIIINKRVRGVQEEANNTTRNPSESVKVQTKEVRHGFIRLKYEL